MVILICRLDCVSKVAPNDTAYSCVIEDVFICLPSVVRIEIMYIFNEKCLHDFFPVNCSKNDLRVQTI